MPKQFYIGKIIVTNAGEPIINGCIEIENGKILNLGKKDDFGSLENKNVKDFKESIICPGFVNLHTHLLYSKLKNKLSGENGLFQWIEKLIEETKYYSENDFISSLEYGIESLLSSGTTFIVENTPNVLSAEIISKSPLKALVGLEVFGSDETEADFIFERYLSLLSPLCYTLHSNVELTFSPHAPYDVSVVLWKKLISWAEKENKFLLTHLEESHDEKLWWNEKKGQAIDFWKKINKLESKLKHWKKYNSGIDFLNRNNLLNKKIIATHLCEASEQDLSLLKEKNISIVHSPRSNYFLNNKIPNLKKWVDLGLLWGLGTDSLASNESLDLLEEARFAIKKQKEIYNYHVLPSDAFKAITCNSAKIIGLDNRIGFLKPGYEADFLVYKIKHLFDNIYESPYEYIFSEINNKKDLTEVCINGKTAWSNLNLLKT